MSDKAFYLTTPIYYVNGKPHIGHAYTSIAADAAARWRRTKGERTYLLTGSDEHGQKVLEKAQSRGMSAKAHVDDMVVHWQQMMRDLDVVHDRFIRTTDADHVAAVQSALVKLKDEGQLYQDTYVGWYSQSAERFWTEKELIDGKCPDTGQPVEKVEETNWFFRMGQYQQALIDHIEANPTYIRPESRKNEVLGFLRKPLGDLCISRPKSRLAWGIEIPFDTDYVTYVWFDALLNYLSGVGWHATHPKPGWDALWPADAHLVGKDILTTHAVYWSTMLMSLGLPLPKTLWAHGWWVSADGQKMSKSLGNVIDVGLLVRNFGLDALRWFLLKEIAFGADGQFTYEGFLTRYNADLANDLGNLAHRSLSMTTSWLGGVVPARAEGTGFEEAFEAQARHTVVRFDQAMSELRFQDGLEAVAELVRAGNKYVDSAAPWALNKNGETAKLGTVLRTLLEVVNLVSGLLACVIPHKSAELLAKLGRTPAQAEADVRAALASSADLNRLDVGASVTLGDPLFPRFREMPDEIAALFATPSETPAMTEQPAPAPKVEAKKAAKDDTGPKAAITYDDFAKIELRAATIVEAAKHPDADRLLVLQVDVGEEKPRQIVAGIASKFTPEQLVGRKIVVVANLAPAKLRGVESQGMLLAAGGPAVVDLIFVDAAPGTIVR